MSENPQNIILKEKIKIGYLLKMFPRLSETFILEELLELERQNTELFIISLEKPGQSEFHDMFKGLKAKIIYLKTPNLLTYLAIIGIHINLFMRFPSKYPKAFWYAFTRMNSTAFHRFLLCGLIYRILEQENIRHLHTHFADTTTRMAKFIHLMTGFSYSFTAHAKDLYANNEIQSHRMKKRIRNARYVVTISEYNKKQLENAGYRIKEGKVRVIYNGLNLQKYPNNEFTLDPINKIRILSVGRLIEKKGFEYLIQACKLLADKGYIFTCTIVGTGPLEEKIKQLILDSDLAEYIKLAGAKTHEKIIRNYYTRATCLVLPCVIAEDGDRDGLPMVLLEAMAMGIPVISTDISGIPELIKNGENGLLVPEKDSLSLANAMEKVICNPLIREKFHNCAPRYIQEKFDIHQNVKQLRKLFHKAVLS